MHVLFLFNEGGCYDISRNASFFSLFAGQNNEMLKAIAMISEDRSFEDNSWIFHQDDVAEKLYLVISGTVTLSMASKRTIDDDATTEIDTLQRGQVFGWSSLVHLHRYTLGAFAGSKCRIVEIDGIALRKILDEHPEQGYYFMNKISELIGERLRTKCIEIFSLNILPAG